MSPDVLGGLEHQVLLALLRLPPEEAHTVGVVEVLGAAAGRDVAPAAVYITLRRLEGKGLLISRTGAPGPQGGRPRRYFAVTDEGLATLRRSRRVLSGLWEGVEGLLDERS